MKQPRLPKMDATGLISGEAFNVYVFTKYTLHIPQIYGTNIPGNYLILFPHLNHGNGLSADV